MYLSDAGSMLRCTIAYAGTGWAGPSRARGSNHLLARADDQVRTGTLLTNIRLPSADTDTGVLPSLVGSIYCQY